MNKPPFKTMVLGNPVVGLTIYGLGAFALYQWTQNGDAWPLGVGALYAMSAASRAGEQADAYRTWKRAWDAMGEAPPARPYRTAAWRALLGMAIVGGIGLYLAAHPDRPGYPFALAWLILGCVVMALVAMIRALMRRPKRAAKAKVDVVAIAVTRPLLPVPDMRRSYAALPEHCQLLFAQQR